MVFSKTKEVHLCPVLNFAKITLEQANSSQKYLRQEWYSILQPPISGPGLSSSLTFPSERAPTV